jgi:prepilin-type N-terminal cleavage/methylation domain-containing protein
MKINKPSSAFTLIELLVVIAIIAILASIALPVFSSVQTRGFQTKDLSNAKQIGLACKLYAADHDGLFPDKDGRAADPPVTPLTSADSSNQAFASLIPRYLPAEKLFYLAKSAWSPTIPDEKMTASTDRCETGTNNYAYELGMTESSNPSFPLIADGPSTGDTAAVFVTDATAKGGVWSGKKAIVVRVDNSGAIENIDATTLTVLGPTGGAANTDIFAANGTTWISATGNSLLLPDTP